MIPLRIINDVLYECFRQERLWGKQNHHPEHWLAILIEEVGEVSREILEGRYGNDCFTSFKYRRELIQVAAVALSMIASYDQGLDKIRGRLLNG